MNSPTNSIPNGTESNTSIATHQETKSTLAARFNLTVPQLVAKLSAGGLTLGTEPTLTKEQARIAVRILEANAPQPKPATPKPPTSASAASLPGQAPTDQAQTTEQLAKAWNLSTDDVTRLAMIASAANRCELLSPFSVAAIALIDDARKNILPVGQFQAHEYVALRQEQLAELEAEGDRLVADREELAERQALAQLGQAIGNPISEANAQVRYAVSSAIDQAGNAIALELESSRIQRAVMLSAALKLKEQRIGVTIPLTEKITQAAKAFVLPPRYSAEESLRLLGGTTDGHL